MSPRKLMSPKSVVLYGIMIALVAVMTLIYVPIPSTKGIFNLGEAMIFTAAFLFGRKVAAIAGAVGAGIVDLLVAPIFFPGTFIIKFCEGFVAGTIVKSLKDSRNVLAARGLAIGIGGLIMIIGYFCYEAFILPLGLSTTGGLGVAITELPWNICQVLIGGLIAMLLAEGIERSYPRISNFRQ